MGESTTGAAGRIYAQPRGESHYRTGSSERNARRGAAARAWSPAGAAACRRRCEHVAGEESSRKKKDDGEEKLLDPAE